MSPRSASALLTTLRTPGWRRAVLLRRALAGLLVLAAVTTALHGARDTEPRAAVLQRKVPAGGTVTEADLALAPVPPHLLPETAVQDPAAVTGQVAATTLPAGAVATELDFIGQQLVTDLLGQPGDLVPLKLAEPEVIPLLRHGDTVTVVSHRPKTPEPLVVAEGGRVILADGVDTSDAATVLIALPEEAARQVAAAALSAPLAVVLTGDPGQ